MDPNTPQLIQIAGEGLAGKVHAEILGSLSRCTIVSINRAAGYVDMNTSAFKRRFAEYITDFGTRAKGITIANLEKAIEERTGKIEAKRKRAKADAGQITMPL